MKFRTKILLCMVWILALALGVGGTLLIHLSFRESLNRERDSLLQSYRLTTSVLGTATGTPQDDALEIVVADAFSQIHRVMDWSYAELNLEGMNLIREGTRPAPETVEFTPGKCIIRVFEAEEQRHYIQLCAEISVNDQSLTMTLIRNISNIYNTRDSMLSVFRWVFLITLSVGGLLSLILSTALTAPLRRLSRATRQMSEGDLSVRLNPKSTDEVGGLSRDFDHMAQKLEENIAAMENTMAAQERFMGSFAHELKTPMTSIIGYADLLRTQSLEGAEAQEAANYIFSESKRLESLSWKLLQLHLAKHEAPELEPVEMDRFVIHLVRQLRPVYQQSGIRLDCRTQPGIWAIDPELMESVLMNLMDNARKAMEQGGIIALMVDYPEGCCRIRVADNGCGMPNEVLNHLTETFYRVDKSRSRAQGGAGLGLSLCNEIVRYHNGELKFESQLKHGTCVSVILKGGAK